MTTVAVTTIDRQVDLHAPPERVWRAITDPTELSAWFGTAADFRPEVGFAGFNGPKKYADNTEGWTGEVLPLLVKLVDGPAGSATD